MNNQLTSFINLRSLKVSFPLTLLTLFSIAPISSANQAENQQFMQECMASFEMSYRQGSGGKEPPKGMSRKYCNCALASIRSGNSIQVAMNNCIKIYNK